jgi:hypothetical protein
MIWALLYLHFFAGGAGTEDFGRFYRNEAAPAIKAEIHDAAQRRAALDAVAEVRRSIDELVKGNRASADEFERVYRDYRSSAEEFDAVIGAGANRQRAALLNMVSARARLMETVSSTEWQAIVARAESTR